MRCVNICMCASVGVAQARVHEHVRARRYMHEKINAAGAEMPSTCTEIELTGSLKQHSVDSACVWLINVPPLCTGKITMPALINLRAPKVVRPPGWPVFPFSAASTPSSEATSTLLDTCDPWSWATKDTAPTNCLYLVQYWLKAGSRKGGPRTSHSFQPGLHA